VTCSAPTVSAIVVTYDHPGFLPGTLDSAIAQDYPADRLEIVVLDDGSTDRTSEIIRRSCRFGGEVIEGA
jgi:glycosyltransferase involved in cell wall biosynthesis